LNICKDGLQRHPNYLRGRPEYNARTFLFSAQPAVAYVGAIGSALIIAFASATWWDKRVTFNKVAIAFAVPIICFVLYVVIKFFNNPWHVFIRPLRWCVKLDKETDKFLEVVDRLVNNQPRSRAEMIANAERRVVQEVPSATRLISSLSPAVAGLREDAVRSSGEISPQPANPHFPEPVL